MYCSQVCSLLGSTPQSRYRNRSIGPSNFGSGWRFPSKTRYMYTPRGFATAAMRRRKTAICNQPATVMAVLETASQT